MKKLSLLAVLILFPALANAGVITTVAVSDLTVSDNNSDGFMDSALSSTDGFIRVFGVSSVQRGVWEYDLSSVDSPSTINSVSVLFEDRGTTIPGEVFLYGYAGDGVSSISDGDLISNLIGSFSFGSTSSQLDYNISLDTSFFQGLIDSNAAYAGIVMVSSDETGFGPGGDICSIESTYSQCAGTTGSSLTIDFGPASVPEPSAILLLSLGLGSFGFARRRRKN